MQNKKEGQPRWADLLSAFPAWLAVFATLFTLYTTIRLHHQDQVAAAHDRLLEHRRDALFSALKVIDLVYSNVPWHDKPAVHPLPVDPQSARDADNQMRIYCQYPQTLAAFEKALGLWNPDTDKSSHQPNVEGLDEFRKQVAKELELPAPIIVSSEHIWISNLDGAK